MTAPTKNGQSQKQKVKSSALLRHILHEDFECAALAMSFHVNGEVKVNQKTLLLLMPFRVQAAKVIRIAGAGRDSEREHDVAPHFSKDSCHLKKARAQPGTAGLHE